MMKNFSALPEYMQTTGLPAYLRITGGDGEDDGADQSGSQSGETSGGESESGKDDADKDESAEALKKIQSDLDTEKKERIKLQREIDKRDAEAKKATEQVNADAQGVEAERDQYKEQYEKLKGIVENQMLDWAIAVEKKYDWHDFEAVRAFINRSDIRLDLDNGKVEGLDLELKRIAKEKPYLLKQKADDGQDGKQPPAAGTPNSGSHPFGGSSQQRETDKRKIGEKYKIFKPGAVGSNF